MLAGVAALRQKNEATVRPSAVSVMPMPQSNLSQGRQAEDGVNDEQVNECIVQCLIPYQHVDERL